MKKKNKTKHFFYDSMLSIVFFIIYFALLFIIAEGEEGGIGILFLIALLSYCSSLVLPEYVDIRCNNKGSKVIMWLTRVIFLLGLVYAIYDITQPCGWFCLKGIKGLIALIGLIVFPLIIVLIYLLIIWIINKKRKK